MLVHALFTCFSREQLSLMYLTKYDELLYLYHSWGPKISLWRRLERLQLLPGQFQPHLVPPEVGQRHRRVEPPELRLPRGPGLLHVQLDAVLLQLLDEERGVLLRTLSPHRSGKSGREKLSLLVKLDKQIGHMADPLLCTKRTDRCSLSSFLSLLFHHIPEDRSDSRRHLPDLDVVRIGLGDLGPFVHGRGQEEVHLARRGIARPQLVLDGDRGGHLDLHLLLVLRRLKDSDVGRQPPEMIGLALVRYMRVRPTGFHTEKINLSVQGWDSIARKIYAAVADQY